MCSLRMEASESSSTWAAGTTTGPPRAGRGRAKSKISQTNAVDSKLAHSMTHAIKAATTLRPYL